MTPKDPEQSHNSNLEQAIKRYAAEQGPEESRPGEERLTPSDRLLKGMGEAYHKPEAEGAGPSLVGTVIGGKYQVVAFIEAGGMGVVYKAMHVELAKPVAIKVLLSSEKNQIGRFKREALAASRIRHPHIIDVTDFGTLDDGRQYVVMEYLEGKNLASLIEAEAPLDLGRTVHLARQICSALQATHRHEIIHRDIKPENIFVINSEDEGAQGGSAEFIKVLDFGIAKAVDLTGEKKLTQTGEIFGTPMYLSPEQARGEVVDHRTDIYSLGLVLYEMVTGRNAISGDSVYTILHNQITQIPPSPAKVAPDSRSARVLSDVIMRALGKGRDHRFPSMERFREALNQAAERAAQEPGAFDITQSLSWDEDEASLLPGRRARVASLALAIVISATLLAGGAILLERRDQTPSASLAPAVVNQRDAGSRGQADQGLRDLTPPGRDKAPPPPDRGSKGAKATSKEIPRKPTSKGEMVPWK